MKKVLIIIIAIFIFCGSILAQTTVASDNAEDYTTIYYEVNEGSGFSGGYTYKKWGDTDQGGNYLETSSRVISGSKSFAIYGNSSGSGYALTREFSTYLSGLHRINLKFRFDVNTSGGDAGFIISENQVSSQTYWFNGQRLFIGNVSGIWKVQGNEAEAQTIYASDGTTPLSCTGGTIYTLQIDFNPSSSGSGANEYAVKVTPDGGSTSTEKIGTLGGTSGATIKTISTGTGITGSNQNVIWDDIEVIQNPSGSTLPVELSTFTAQYLAGKPLLYWTTQSETDNMGWFVYRNQVEDFTSATKVSGMIEGHGTTTQAQSYVYEDVIANPQVDDVYYYWLESVDYSGTIHHFDKVAMITIPDINNPNPNVTPPQVYDLISSPNPFNETTNIKFMLTQTAFVDVAIYDVKGALVKSFDTQHVTAEVPVSFQWNGKDDKSHNLSNGIYLYSVKVNGQDYATKQVILMK